MRNMRARLIERAFRLFSKHGFDKVSLDEIAADAGVTKGSLYWHFSSKKEVILEACDLYYRLWRERIREETAGISDPRERLRAAVWFSVRNCMMDTGNRVFTTELFALSLHDPDVRQGWARFYDSVRDYFIDLVKAVRAKGAMKTRNIRRAVDLMLVAFEGIKLRSVFEPRRLTKKEGRKHLEEFMAILDGLDSGRAAG